MSQKKSDKTYKTYYAKSQSKVIRDLQEIVNSANLQWSKTLNSHEVKFIYDILNRSENDTNFFPTEKQSNFGSKILKKLDSSKGCSDRLDKIPQDKIVIYTDGGCRGNPGIGGWGAWLCYGKHEKKLSGAEKYTTNNRMELMAAIKALEAIKSKYITIDLYTDSKYVIQGITQWSVKWKKNGWKKSKNSKSHVKNVDLWQKLDKLNQTYQISWFWVKGHSDDKGNDMADFLANQAMNDFQV